MRNKKLLVVLLGLVLMLAVIACGNNKTSKKSDDKKAQETVQGKTENDIEEEGNVKEDTEKEVETSGDATQTETSSSTDNSNAQSVEPSVEKVTMYAKSSVNVRSGAGASNTKVGSLTKGQEVTKVGEENGWSKIEFNGTVGYVSSKYLSTEKVSASTANSSTGNSNSANNNANNGSTTPSTPVHEHMWVIENKTYEYIKTYVNGCNGCGYPLFTITESGTQPIENLYFHPACYSEKLGMDCTGGGFHNESYTRGYCYFCGGKIEFRQCMWTEMGKLCGKNEALGTYEKIEFDQNHFMYLNSCDCSKNCIMIDGEDGKGLIFVKEYCSICGAMKE